MHHRDHPKRQKFQMSGIGQNAQWQALWYSQRRRKVGLSGLASAEGIPEGDPWVSVLHHHPTGSPKRHPQKVAEEEFCDKKQYHLQTRPPTRPIAKLLPEGI
jgi:hypothetical protein